MSDMRTRRPVARFDRRFFEGVETFTAIGRGALGGKAAGQRRARDVLESRPDTLRFDALEISVPTLTVIATDVFDLFLDRTGLRALVAAEPGDHHVARAFQQADLPVEIAGDLWDLVRRVRTPLAVRSSSLLEDAIDHPFAGVYGTKMTPNDAFDAETRFRRLVEAIKYVWATAFFRDARAAVRAAGRDPDDEKMAVIVQEVVGRRHAARFYPEVAAVARSWNFYPYAAASPEEGVIDLALGLGKTIVDGGRTWTYSPDRPKAAAPLSIPDELLEQTQTGFWAIRMGPPPAYDPTVEVEYMERYDLAEAERDGVLHRVASTWDVGRDRLVPGTAAIGPRVLDFAPLLHTSVWPFNPAVRGLMALFEDALESPVEIELALTFPERADAAARLGFLQVRPMARTSEAVEVPESSLRDEGVVIASGRVLGNGVAAGIRDLVYVRPDAFDAMRTRAIAGEIGALNRRLVDAGKPYVLIGFGRWGSSEPTLGIPVTWAQIAGARAIVEAASPRVRADMSQGSHFFHNIVGLRVPYFSIGSRGNERIDWDWLESLPCLEAGSHVRWVESPQPLSVRVDGRAARGVITRAQEGLSA